MTKRAAIYARVSTDEQAERGRSIPTQLEACRDYAKRQGWQVDAEYADDCSGTIPVQERPQGRRLYGSVSAGDIDAVVLYTIDRAARDEDVIEFLIFKRDMKAAGVELHFCDSGRTADDPIAGIVDYFKAAQASEERKKIRERTGRGLRAKAKDKWVGIRVPYGYRKIGLKQEAYLEIDPEQAAIVQRIFAMYTGPELLSLFAIAETLTAERVPTPKGAKLWGHTTIRALLTQRLFVGEVKYSDIVITQPDLAIIDPQTFEAVRARMRKNKEQGRRNRKSDYLLAGFTRCYCGRAVCRIVGRDKRNKYTYHYYKCGGYKSGHEKKCDNYYLRAEKLEAVIWETVTRGLSREVLIEALRARQKQKAAEYQPKRERLARVKKLIIEAERGISGLAQRVAQAEKDKQKKVANILEAQMRSEARSLDALTAERDRLALELQEYAFTADQTNVILQRAEALRKKVMTGKPTLAQKREFLRTLDLHVEICKGHDEVNISYVLGEATLPIEYTKRKSRERRGRSRRSRS